MMLNFVLIVFISRKRNTPFKKRLPRRPKRNKRLKLYKLKKDNNKMVYAKKKCDICKGINHNKKSCLQLSSNALNPLNPNTSFYDT